MILVINTALDKMSTATREALVNYMAANGISWSWQQEAPFAHLTIDEPLKFPSFADLDPAYIEQLRDALAKPATSRFSTATGLDLDRLAPISVPPRQEGETDEAFRQRILHTHQLSKPIRHARCNPLLVAPYAGVVFKGEGAYNGLATELSKMTPDTFREQYECTPDPLAWINHNGGPCPVRHEEVEVQCRGYHTGVVKRCWPEAVNWHWGRPGSATTPIDVLRWRKVQASDRKSCAPVVCEVSKARHQWLPVERSTIGPLLRCAHCGYRVHGPYEDLPLDLLNDDDPRLHFRD